MAEGNDMGVPLNWDEGGNLMGVGRGKLLGDMESTPVRGVHGIGNPVSSSTYLVTDSPTPTQRMPSLRSFPGVGRSVNTVGRPVSSFTHMHNDEPLSPGVNTSELGHLITQLAHQIGENIASQLNKSVGSQHNRPTPTPSLNMGQGHPDLSTTGVKLVMKSDVREPPYFRGDGTDKHTVHEWEEIVDVYLKKRGVPLQEYSQEIMSRLMGKARDIVKVTLRSIPSLRPTENPKLVFDILKQHFSEVTYSSMPLADFYNTLPLNGESPMDYWIRLNKAVDAIALASVLKCKTAEKWTANEIQEHLIEHQREARTKSQVRPVRPKHIGAHAQTSLTETITVQNTGEPSSPHITSAPPSTSQTESVYIQSLISLLDRVLEQKAQTAAVQSSYKGLVNTFQRKCRVCQSIEHSTTAHCRQENLCMGCYKPGHWKKDCQQRRLTFNGTPRQPQTQSQDQQNGAHLN
ncbi:hypothetical protein ACEWY4_018361 [Coilia grayii]|uniref:CCHC-type domain-containing protein n=1 Tax=Coilia grayii TaxID=363190 RepID=A0ABD1JJF3_9TELE